MMSKLLYSSISCSDCFDFAKHCCSKQLKAPALLPVP